MYPGFLRGTSNMRSTKDAKSLQQKQCADFLPFCDIQSSDLMALTRLVLELKESLKNFTCVCLKVSDTENYSYTMKDVHEHLNKVLEVVEKAIDKYPVIASPELYVATNSMITCVQSCRGSTFCSSDIEQQVNQLSSAFRKSISSSVFPSQSIESDISHLKKQNFNQGNKLNAVFGIELDQHLSSSKRNIPFVVSKCIKEVEEHGIHMKGIYRVSAVRSKVNELRDEFEKYGSDIALNGTNPNVVANVLKLYLRQLPQPLFTFDLYPEFIRIAKMYGSDLDSEMSKRCSEELSKTVAKLPKAYYDTASAVMHHLQHVSNESKINNMSAYNLAVIFGPTLLHCMKNNENHTSGTKAALYDNAHQIRAIELMIKWADVVF